jgi:hypothetical protein
MLWVGVAGALLIIQSTFWEFARMRPDFNFLVEPWSMRGTEMVHGDIYVATGLALLAGLTAVAMKPSERPAIGAAIAVAMTAAAVVITAVFVDRELVITFSFIVQAVLAIVSAIVLYRLASILLGEDRIVGWASLGATAAAVAIGFILAFVILNGVTLSVGAAVAMLVAMLPLLALALSGQPSELIANRMLVMMAFVAILALGLQGGAIRQTLVDAQAAADFGAPADYKDTQVTSGYFWAQLGALMVFVSAVGQWAKRRDHILNVRRARRQRAAAEASAREIQEALESAGLGASGSAPPTQ